MNFLHRHQQPKPKFRRIDAFRNSDYDASSSPSSSSSSFSAGHATPPMVTRSLEFGDKRSFRVEGIDGEFELICRSLGLSGREDFSIPESAWEAMKMRSSSDVFPRSSRIGTSNSPALEEMDKDGRFDQMEVENLEDFDKEEEEVGKNVRSGGGIVGARPAVLAPPPGLLGRKVDGDDGSSTWDLFRGLAPEGGNVAAGVVGGGEVNELGFDGEEETSNGVMMGSSCSVSSSYDGDHSSGATPTTSPNVRFRQIIRGWMKGQLLGRGSYGSVYEAISV